MPARLRDILPCFLWYSVIKDLGWFTKMELLKMERLPMATIVDEFQE